MRAIVQRVAHAEVRVRGLVVGHCGPGLMVLVAAHRNDTLADAKRCADRVLGLRVFGDDQGQMNLALRDLPDSGSPQILAVSNFTLYGDTNKGRRPSFVQSAPFEEGRVLFEAFVSALRALGAHVETGHFGEHMDLSLENDGPVTLILDVIPTGPVE